MIDYEVTTSSNIRHVRYDDLSGELFIDFKGERQYRYSGVPEAVARALVEAPSIGERFADTVKDKFPCTRVK